MGSKNRQKVLKILEILGIGFLIGAINGFFGGGGGMICVPLLLMLGQKSQKAHATAILTMLPISIASSIVYYSNMSFDWLNYLFIVLGSVAGGGLGAVLLKKIPNWVLLFVFPLVMIIVGVKMFF